MATRLLEWAAVVLALTYVLLATRQSRWCWPSSAASSAIYFVLFARAGLPMQAALQVFYVVMSGYGWFAWGASRGKARELPVSVWPVRRHVTALVLVVAATFANLWLVGADPHSLVAFADAFVAWGSVVAMWLVTRKVLENWLYWIAFDLVAAALYYSQGLVATTGLFLVYVVLAVRGFIAWRRALGPVEPVKARPDEPAAGGP